jgi:ERCC4-related helicase
MCLKSFKKYTDLTHLLIYVNSCEEAELSKKYIDKLLSGNNFPPFTTENFYNKALYCNCKYDLTDEITNFKNAQFGIVSCVHIFSEGFDLPKLNGSCFATNMQSEIRVIQSLLRPNRLDFNYPNKIAYAIIPYIDNDDFMNNNQSFNKVRTIISKIRNVDENIEQKISVLATKLHKKKIEEKIVCRILDDDIENYDFEENNDKLHKLKIRLRNSKALMTKSTEEQDEYDYMRLINKNLNIQSKQEYINSQSANNSFINDPENYFKLKGVWTNWYDFMGVDTNNFIQLKEDWIKFCKEKNINSLKRYINACEIYKELPKEPNSFYKTFTNLLEELKIKQRFN